MTGKNAPKKKTKISDDKSLDSVKNLCNPVFFRINGRRVSLSSSALPRLGVQRCERGSGWQWWAMCCSAPREVMNRCGCQDWSVDSRREKSDQSFQAEVLLAQHMDRWWQERDGACRSEEGRERRSALEDDENEVWGRKGEFLRERIGERERVVNQNRHQMETGRERLDRQKGRKRRMGKVWCHPVGVNIPEEKNVHPLPPQHSLKQLRGGSLFSLYSSTNYRYHYGA